MRKYASIFVFWVAVGLALCSCSSDRSRNESFEFEIKGSLKELLLSEGPYSKRDWCNIYLSILEVENEIREDPDFQITFIDRWRQKVDEIQMSNVNNHFGLDPTLTTLGGIDFDVLARGIWFPSHFGHRADDQKYLELIEEELSKYFK